MSKQKLSINSIFLLLITIILVILLGTFIAIYAITYKPVIAFYNVPDYSRNAITQIINETSTKNYKYIVLDKSKPLSQQTKGFKKAKLLFTLSDCDSKELAASKIFKPINADILETMPNAITQTVPVNNNTIKYIPLLYDFYEIDVNYDFYQKTGTKNLTFWSDLKSVLEKEEKFVKFPLIFDGNDDTSLIDIFGMLYESFSTPEEYEKLLDSLYQAYKQESKTSGELLKFLESLPDTSTAFKSLITELQNFKKANYITNEVFSNNYGDSLSLINENLCGIYFTTLFNHRLISRDVISNYKSIYCPSYETNVKRKFCAPETVVFCLKNNEETQKIIKTLAIDEQTALSSYAGISPVNRECTVSDIQASDVRYWLAASSGPLLPLSAALPSDSAKKITANYFQSLMQ